MLITIPPLLNGFGNKMCKISTFPFILRWIYGKFQDWRNKQANEQTENKKQQDEADLVGKTTDIAEKADEAADEIDRILKQN